MCCRLRRYRLGGAGARTAAQAGAMRQPIKALRDRERIANEFVIERMVEGYRKIWQNAVLSNHGGMSG